MYCTAAFITHTLPPPHTLPYQAVESPQVEGASIDKDMAKLLNENVDTLKKVLDNATQLEQVNELAKHHAEIEQLVQNAPLFDEVRC